MVGKSHGPVNHPVPLDDVHGSRPTQECTVRGDTVLVRPTEGHTLRQMLGHQCPRSDHRIKPTRPFPSQNNLSNERGGRNEDSKDSCLGWAETLLQQGWTRGRRRRRMDRMRVSRTRVLRNDRLSSLTQNKYGRGPVRSRAIYKLTFSSNIHKNPVTKTSYTSSR